MKANPFEARTQEAISRRLEEVRDERRIKTEEYGAGRPGILEEKLGDAGLRGMDITEEIIEGAIDEAKNVATIPGTILGKLRRR